MRKGNGIRVITAAILVAAQILSGCSGAFAEEAAWDASEPAVTEATADFSEAMNEEAPEDVYFEADEAVPGEDVEAALDFDASEDEMLDEISDELFEDVIDDEEDAAVFEEEYTDEDEVFAGEELLIEEDASEITDDKADGDSVEIIYNLPNGEGATLSRYTEVVEPGNQPLGCKATPKAGYYCIGWTDGGYNFWEQYLVSESEEFVPVIDWEKDKGKHLSYAAMIGKSNSGSYRIKINVSDPDHGWVTKYYISGYTPSNVSYVYTNKIVYHGKKDASVVYSYKDVGSLWYGGSDIVGDMAVVTAEGYKIDHWELNANGQVFRVPANAAPDYNGLALATNSLFPDPRVYYMCGWNFSQSPWKNSLSPSGLNVLTAVIKKEGVTPNKIYYKVKASSDGSVSRSMETYTGDGSPKGSTAYPAVGCVFKEWQDANGNPVSTDATFVPPATQGVKTYYAIFEEDERAAYTFKIEGTDGKGHGSFNLNTGIGSFVNITEEGDFLYVLSVRQHYGSNFSITAEDGSVLGDPWHFVKWVDSDGKTVSTSKTLSSSALPDLGAGESAVITAVYEKDQNTDVIRYIFETKGLEDNTGHGSLVMDETKYGSLIEEKSARRYVLVMRPDDNTGFYVTASESTPDSDPWHFAKWVDAQGNTLSSDYVIYHRSLPRLNAGQQAVITAVYEPDQCYRISVKPDCELYGSVKKGHISMDYFGDPYIQGYTETITKDLYTHRITGYLYSGNYNDDTTSATTLQNRYYCVYPEPKDGFEFDHWEKDGVVLDAGELNEIYLDEHFDADHTYIAVFKPINEDQMVTVKFVTNGHGSLLFGTRKEQGESFEFKQLPGPVSITVEAENSEDGYYVKQWTCSDGSEPVNSRKLEVTEIKPSDTGTVTYTAEYAPYEETDYKLTFAVNNPAYGKVTRYGSEENLTDPSKTTLVSKTGGLKFGLQATAASSDYVLARWELNGKELTQFKYPYTYPGSPGAYNYIDRTADLIITQDSVLTAVFQPKAIKDGTAGEYYTICYEAEKGGSVSAKEEYYIIDNPSAVTGSEARPSKGYLVEGWYQGDKKVSSDALFKPSFNDFKDLADENKKVTYTAKFEVDQGTISGSGGSDSGGSGSGSGSSGSGSGELTLSDLDKQILSSSSDEGPDGAEYGKLTLRVAKAKKTSVKLKWNNMSGATGYVLYGAKCGTKFERIGLINGTSYTVSSLTKGTYYKYKLAAVKIAGNKQTVVGHSKVVHAATTGGKVGNPKKIVLKSKKKVTLKKGKSSKIKVKVTKPAGKKVKTHRKVAYESSDPNVATVSTKGKITAVGQGTCKIYVYTQNGLYKAVTVKVK